jgi:hypothetical protein
VSKLSQFTARNVKLNRQRILFLSQKILAQDERQYAIKAFKSGSKDVMVASGVASKGLDFDDRGLRPSNRTDRQKRKDWDCNDVCKHEYARANAAGFEISANGSGAEVSLQGWVNACSC